MPTIDGIPVVTQQNTGLSLPKSPPPASLPPLTVQDRTKFHSLFYKAGPQNGLISGSCILPIRWYCIFDISQARRPEESFSNLNYQPTNSCRYGTYLLHLILPALSNLPQESCRYPGSWRLGHNRLYHWHVLYTSCHVAPAFRDTIIITTWTIPASRESYSIEGLSHFQQQRFFQSRRQHFFTEQILGSSTPVYWTECSAA